jgi:tetratricopeptide (TPR) repeat protein
MADSPRIDASRAIDDALDADRDAKIEQLLLDGLDHYFAGRYERAINVWTRALFFDRSHARARAYIDRARTALAERQRHSEELLESGVAALDRGLGSEARRFLQAAVDSGARVDELHPLIARLNRQSRRGSSAQAVVPAKPVLATRAVHLVPAAAASGASGSVPHRRLAFALTTAALAVAVLAVYAVALHTEPRLLLDTAEPAPRALSAPAPHETAFPPPRRGEMALTRARELAVRGRLHEALTALDDVRPTDLEKADADRIRGEVQRQLLELAPAPYQADARVREAVDDSPR